MRRDPTAELIIRAMQMVLCVMIGFSLGKGKVQDSVRPQRADSAPLLEPTPTQEEINERVAKALHLNPPIN